MEKLFSIPNPTVGLANNGTEEHKGTPVLVETHERLKNSEAISFIGNVEGKEIPFGKCDVLVADGFSGNIVLKLSEGLAKMFSHSLKAIFKKNIVTVLGALCVKKGISDFKKSFDYTEYGGAPLMGIAKPVIKAHGSSNAVAFKNALRQAQ